MTVVRANKIATIILIIVSIYGIITFINQQKKLNSYSTDLAYYQTQIDNLEAKKSELLSTQENVSSEEYIEKVARESLEMYLPNETVYIDINK